MKGRGSRGIALVLAVLVLAILIVVVLELVYTARVEEALARNQSEGRQAEMAADAAVELAKALLEPRKAAGTEAAAAPAAPGAAETLDTPDSRWAGRRSGIKLGEADVEMEITDESSKFNLRLLLSENEAVKKWAEDVLLRIVKSARTRSEEEEEEEIEPEKIVERIVAWARKGETGSESGVSGIKAGEDESRFRLLGIAELAFLEGITPRMLFGEDKTAEDLEKERKEREEELSKDDDELTAEDEEETKEDIPLADVLTVFGDGRVNINTACKEVIMALHEGITDEVAEKIISHREAVPGAQGGSETPPAQNPPPAPGASPDPTAEKWFQTVAELRTVEGMVDSQKQLDVLGDLLRLTGKAPAQGKDAVEDYADAPLAVKGQFFRAVFWIKCGRVFRTYTAILKRRSDGGAAVMQRAEGMQ